MLECYNTKRLTAGDERSTESSARMIFMLELLAQLHTSIVEPDILDDNFPQIYFVSDGEW